MWSYYIIYDDENGRVGLAPNKISKASIFSFDNIPLPLNIKNINTHVPTNGEELLLNFIMIAGSAM